jgi:hypothetical protein
LFHISILQEGSKPVVLVFSHESKDIHCIESIDILDRDFGVSSGFSIDISEIVPREGVSIICLRRKIKEVCIDSYF